ncbi:MAG: hypothetical protein WAW88_04240 [Nocardioides sp.]
MHRPILLAFYSLAVLTHVLVLVRVIPYDWVNGGRSTSYAAQAVQSAVSIVILLGLFAFVWRLMHRSSISRTQWRLLVALAVLLTIGAVQQLLGTAFERSLMVLVLVAGVAGHSMLARDLRPRPTT